MQYQDKKMFVLEGNIGAGKSTLLKILGQSIPEFTTIQEPTNKWQHIGDDDNNILNLFYKDTKRWAYTFQSYAFISRVQAILDFQATQPTNTVSILERSVYCDRFCFAKNCFEAGLMSELEWQIYKEWFTWLVENYVPRPTGFIYLRTTPTTCYNRSLSRGRTEESGIPLTYFEALHKKHDDWLIDKQDLSGVLEQIPVLSLDCNEEFENNPKQQMAHLNSIRKFIEETSCSMHLTTKKQFSHLKTV